MVFFRMVVFFVFLASNSYAGVIVKNGVFNVQYSDLDGSFLRVFNSKGNSLGMYGRNWTMDYEISVESAVDGSLIVRELSGSVKVRYFPNSFKKSALDASIKKIVSLAKSSAMIGTDQELKKYEKSLFEDIAFRKAEWEKFTQKGKLESTPIVVGTKFYSSAFHYQTLTKTQDGYVRTSSTGKTENFNTHGELVKITYENGDYKDFFYTKDAHLIKIVDNYNKVINFEYNDKGFVKRIQFDDIVAKYEYNNKNELVKSTDSHNNVYEYKYDSVHRLIEIVYSDSTKMKIAYYDETKKNNVSSIVERNGLRKDYDYTFSSNGLNCIKATEMIKNAKNELVSSRSYEFVYKNKDTGESWLAEFSQKVDDKSLKIHYHEHCQSPVLIEESRGQSKIEYDAQCRLLKKETPIHTVELKYDPHVHRVSTVTMILKLLKNKPFVSNFTYDSSGHLVTATNSDGQSIRLFYDTLGRLVSIVEKQGTLTFKYDAGSRMIEIVDPVLGSISIMYTNSNQIKRLSSNQGQKIADIMRNKIEILNALVAPSGVSLF